MKTKHLSVAAGLAMAALVPGTLAGNELRDAFRVEANGKPIDVDIGHAAPFVTDFDGDGAQDLLVGQFGEGKLRIYRNQGKNDAPEFGGHVWFQAGGKDGRVPSG